MFEIAKAKIVRWKQFPNNTLFVPESLDTTCPCCQRSPINFAPVWAQASDFMFGHAQCAGCHERPTFFLLNVPTKGELEETAKSRLYLHPSPPIIESWFFRNCRG